jgi:hypothetical protein
MNSKVYKWRYAFDYDVIIERFLNDIKGSFFVISFDEFKSTKFLGRTLIDRVIGHNTKINSFWNSKLHFVEKTNIRGDGDTIEIDYLSNFLGINMTKEIFEENKSVFLPIVSNRLGMIDLVKEDLYKRFKERFPQVSIKFNLN